LGGSSAASLILHYSYRLVPPLYAKNKSTASNEIKVWQLPGGQLLHKLKTVDRLTDVNASQGRLVAACHGERITAWTLKDAVQLWTVSRDRDKPKGKLAGYSLQLAPEGRYALTRSAFTDSFENVKIYDLSKEMAVWDISAGQFVSGYWVEQDGHSILQWMAPDELFLTNGTGIGVAGPPDWKPWQAASGSLIYGALSPDRTTVAASWKGGGTDLIPAAQLGNRLSPVPVSVQGKPEGLVRFISDQWLWVCPIRGECSLVEVGQGLVAKTFPEGSVLEETNPSSGHFVLVNKTQAEVWQGPNRLFALPGKHNRCRFSSDGRFLFASDYEEVAPVTVWDTSSGKQIGASAPFRAFDLAPSGDGHWLVVTCHDGSIQLLEVNEGVLKP